MEREENKEVCLRACFAIRVETLYSSCWYPQWSWALTHFDFAFMLASWCTLIFWVYLWTDACMWLNKSHALKGFMHAVFDNALNYFEWFSFAIQLCTALMTRHRFHSNCLLSPRLSSGSVFNQCLTFHESACVTVKFLMRAMPDTDCQRFSLLLVRMKACKHYASWGQSDTSNSEHAVQKHFEILSVQVITCFCLTSSFLSWPFWREYKALCHR